MDSAPDTGLWVDTTPANIPVDLAQTDPYADTVFSSDTVPEFGLPQGFEQTFEVITSLPGLVSGLTKAIISLLKDVESFDFTGPFKALAPLLGSVEGMLSLPGTLAKFSGEIPGEMALPDAKDLAGATWQWLTDHTIGLLFQGMLEGGLEVDVGKFDENAMRGVHVVDTMLGFTIFLQFVNAAVEQFGSGIFGGRWGKAFTHILKEIPEELGLTWAMGMSIDEAFKIAVGRSIEEGINKQKRGNRIGWPQLRTMLKQHVLSPDQFQELMENQGFPDEQIQMLSKLQDVVVPIGDIAQLWYRDVIDDATALTLIEENGYTPKQSQWLFDMYMKKSQNEASGTYRSVARQLFVGHLITEDQYRNILIDARYPAKLIKEDIAAILLEQRVGRLLHSVTVIKERYLHHDLDPTHARTALRELNYSEEYITELLQTWGYQPLRKQHGLSQSKILSYYISGILKPDQAKTQLLATGLTPDAVTFLLAHPKATPGAKVHQRTPGLVTQAYVDGAILPSDLPAAFTSAGVQDQDLAYYTKIAQYRLSNRKGSPTPHQEPNTALVREAQKAGLIDFQHAVTMYEQLGWSPDWAMTIAEVVNKGPYQAPGTPAFATPEDAMAYMTAQGYILIPPMDPRLLAAESMLAMLGWSWRSPAGGGYGEGTVPPPTALPPPVVINPPPLPGI